MVFEDTTWREEALEIVEKLARQGKRFTADTLRAEIGRPAPHQNMVGSVFTTAQRRGLITKVANANSRVKSRNGGHQYEWLGSQARNYQ